MTTPTPAVWSDGDPLMTAIAAAVSEQCQTHPEQGLTVDDPRTIAAVAATVARQVLGTPTTATTPAPDRMPCSLATLHRPHPPHTWEPQPGMTPLGCPGAPASAPAAPADRATVLREAADELAAEREATDINVAVYPRYNSSQKRALSAGEFRLRRLADEAQPTATEGFREWLGRQRVHGVEPATAATEEPQP